MSFSLFNERLRCTYIRSRHMTGETYTQSNTQRRAFYILYDIVNLLRVLYYYFRQSIVNYYILPHNIVVILLR